MRRIFGIGETVYDILFRNGQPVAGVPGGSVFNGLISLGRCGLNCSFITEIGDDRVGRNILDFMHDNGINTDGISCYEGKKTAISLAYLDDNGDAHYSFYKDYPNNRLDFRMPEIRKDDIVAFGAYFALNPVLRNKVRPFLEYAKSCGAILYYDLNFRSNHSHEAHLLSDTFTENFRLADIVRASDEDLVNLYGNDDFRSIYLSSIAPYCRNFICTRGARGVFVLDGGSEYSFPAKEIVPVSTIGAGDNYNAGTIYGLVREEIGKEELSAGLSREKWDRLAQLGVEFGTEVCLGTSNYVSPGFASKYRLK